jgi:hypothetical protein
MTTSNDPALTVLRMLGIVFLRRRRAVAARLVGDGGPNDNHRVLPADVENPRRAS